MHPKLDQLTREGYCVFEEILSADLLGRLRSASDKVLDANEYEKKRSNQGNIVGMHYQNSAFLDLITWPAALEPWFASGPWTPALRSSMATTVPGRSRRPTPSSTDWE